MKTMAGVGTVPILMYHGIDNRSAAAFAPFVVPPALFAEQIGALREGGFVMVTMSRLAQLRRTGAMIPADALVITFDDGFADFAESAVPVLVDAGVPATLYVPTGYVGGRAGWLRPEGEHERRLLSWGALADLAAQGGVECGAHSHGHGQLDRFSRAEAARDIALCKALLEDHLQQETSSFAYPYGYASSATRELVAQAGFSNACTVGDLVCRSDHDLFQMPRFTVTPGLTAESLVELVRRPGSARDTMRAFARRQASRTLRGARLKKPQRATGLAPLSE